MEPTPTFSDDLRRYIALLLHWWWLLALMTVLAGVSAYLVSVNSTPVYQASSSLLINEAPATATTDFSSLQTSERLARTYSELMVKKPVLDGVIERLSLSTTANDLRKTIQVQPVRDTQLIVVRVEDTSPSRAAAIANALGVVFAEQNQQLQASRYAASKGNMEAQLTQLDEQIQNASAQLNRLGESPAQQAERDRLETVLAQYRQTYASLLQSYEQVRVAEAQSTSNVVQAEAAEAPRSPIRPKTFNNTALASVVGMMLAVGVVFLIEALDDTLRGPDDITRQLGVPVLGLIGSHDSDGDTPIAVREPRSPVVEAFRSLRTNIQFASLDRPVHSILITSPSPEEGKSTIATNLATVLAQGEGRVVLLDTDLRRPKIHRLLGLSNSGGVSGVFLQLQIFLDGKVNLNGALQETGVPGLKALTSGKLPPNPAEMLGSERMQQVLDLVQREADVVVLDSPPVLAVTDASVLAPLVDGVILVVKPGETKLAAARGAIEQLRRVGAKLLGVVLNGVDFKRSSYYYYHYKGYYYNYDEDYNAAPAPGKNHPKNVKVRGKAR